MKKIKLYKSEGREIEINDAEDAAKTMMLDGWRLSPVEETKAKAPRRKKPVSKEV
tara:strand:- start:631 stop:795 length:165 start_codon:yes stop_codon:yes gene_type:complete